MTNIIKFHFWLQEFMTKNPVKDWPTAEVIYEMLSEALAKDMYSKSWDEISFEPELTSRDLN